VLIGVFALYVAPARWSGGWMSMALTIREYTVLLWPLALSAGAWQGRRAHRSRVGELLATTARSRARRMLPVLAAMAIALGSAYLLVVAAGAVKIASTAHHFPAGHFAAVAAAGALSLAAAAWLGLGIGRVLPSPATAPVLAALGVIAVLSGALARPIWLAAVLSPMYGSGQFHPFQTIDNRVSAALVIFMAGLAGAGAVLLTAGSRWARAGAVAPALLGLAVAALVVPRDEAALDSPVDPVARELVCTGDAPPVCVSRIHAGVLAALTPLARQGLATLARIPGAPTAVHEDTDLDVPGENHPPTAGVVTITVRIDKHGGLAHPAAVVPEIVMGLGVRGSLECNEHRSSSVERAAAYYLLGTEPRSDVGIIPGVIYESPDINAEAVRLWQGLRALPADRALARVGAVREAILACRDDGELLSK
jgi:hypothetical protein